MFKKSSMYPHLLDKILHLLLSSLRLVWAGEEEEYFSDFFFLSLFCVVIRKNCYLQKCQCNVMYIRKCIKVPSYSCIHLLLMVNR